ncbi:TPA: hypothetical protein R4Z25_000056 [Klebsiella oxytoca]|nr:hypothetical protein [Klebsiella oxytoca]
MTSKLTRERIEWLHYAATGLAANGTEMAMSPQDVIALTECCLAAMDSEPVVFTDERNLHHIAMGRETSLIWGKQNQEAGDIALYRRAQPEPGCQHQWRHGGANKLQNQKQCIKCGRVELDAQSAPVVLDGLTAAVNRLLNSDGSRGSFSAIRCYDAHQEIEKLLAVSLSSKVG